MKTIPWLRIVNKTAEEIELDIDGIIGWDEDSWPEIKKKLSEIASGGQRKLIVNIFSPGGFVSDGLMIHDALKIAKAKIETRVFSMTASAATIVAQAGDVRKMSSNALYLIHHAWLVAIGNVNDMKAAMQDLEAVDNRIADIYIKKGSNPEDIKSLMDENNGNGIWIDAETALKYGLIDEIIEPSRAAAFVPEKEFFDKYKLPQIPDELMAKVSLIPKDGSDSSTGKRHSFMAAVTESFNKFFGSADDPEEDPEKVKDPPVEEPEKIPEEEPDKTIPQDSQSGITQGVNVSEETLNQTLVLQSRITELETENETLRQDLQAATTSLAKAGARSTIISGPVGTEGDDNMETPIKAEVKETLKALNKVMNGEAYVENPKPKN